MLKLYGPQMLDALAMPLLLLATLIQPVTCSAAPPGGGCPIPFSVYMLRVSDLPPFSGVPPLQFSGKRSGEQC